MVSQSLLKHFVPYFMCQSSPRELKEPQESAVTITGGSLVGQIVPFLFEVLVYTIDPIVRFYAFQQILKSKHLLKFLSLPSHAAARKQIMQNSCDLLLHKDPQVILYGLKLWTLLRESFPQIPAVLSLLVKLATGNIEKQSTYNKSSLQPLYGNVLCKYAAYESLSKSVPFLSTSVVTILIGRCFQSVWSTGVMPLSDKLYFAKLVVELAPFSTVLCLLGVEFLWRTVNRIIGWMDVKKHQPHTITEFVIEEALNVCHVCIEAATQLTLKCWEILPLQVFWLKFILVSQSCSVLYQRDIPCCKGLKSSALCCLYQLVRNGLVWCESFNEQEGKVPQRSEGDFFLSSSCVIYWKELISWLRGCIEEGEFAVCQHLVLLSYAMRWNMRPSKSSLQSDKYLLNQDIDRGSDTSVTVAQKRRRTVVDTVSSADEDVQKRGKLLKGVWMDSRAGKGLSDAAEEISTKHQTTLKHFFAQSMNLDILHHSRKEEGVVQGEEEKEEGEISEAEKVSVDLSIERVSNSDDTGDALSEISMQEDAVGDIVGEPIQAISLRSFLDLSSRVRGVAQPQHEALEEESMSIITSDSDSHEGLKAPHSVGPMRFCASLNKSPESFFCSASDLPLSDTAVGSTFMQWPLYAAVSKTDGERPIAKEEKAKEEVFDAGMNWDNEATGRPWFWLMSMESLCNENFKALEYFFMCLTDVKMTANHRIQIDEALFHYPCGHGKDLPLTNDALFNSLIALYELEATQRFSLPVLLLLLYTMSECISWFTPNGDTINAHTQQEKMEMILTKIILLLQSSRFKTYLLQTLSTFVSFDEAKNATSLVSLPFWIPKNVSLNTFHGLHRFFSLWMGRIVHNLYLLGFQIFNKFKRMLFKHILQSYSFEEGFHSKPSLEFEFLIATFLPLLSPLLVEAQPLCFKLPPQGDSYDASLRNAIMDAHGASLKALTLPLSLNPTVLLIQLRAIFHLSLYVIENKQTLAVGRRRFKCLRSYRNSVKTLLEQIVLCISKGKSDGDNADASVGISRHSLYQNHNLWTYYKIGVFACICGFPDDASTLFEILRKQTVKANSSMWLYGLYCMAQANILDGSLLSVSKAIEMYKEAFHCFTMSPAHILHNRPLPLVCIHIKARIKLLRAMGLLRSKLDELTWLPPLLDALETFKKSLETLGNTFWDLKYFFENLSRCCQEFSLTTIKMFIVYKNVSASLSLLCVFLYLHLYTVSMKYANKECDYIMRDALTGVFSFGLLQYSLKRLNSFATIDLRHVWLEESSVVTQNGMNLSNTSSSYQVNGGPLRILPYCYCLLEVYLKISDAPLSSSVSTAAHSMNSTALKTSTNCLISKELVDQSLHLINTCITLRWPIPPRVFSPYPLPHVALDAQVLGRRQLGSTQKQLHALPVVEYTGVLKNAMTMTWSNWRFARILLTLLDSAEFDYNEAFEVFEAVINTDSPESDLILFQKDIPIKHHQFRFTHTLDVSVKELDKIRVYCIALNASKMSIGTISITKLRNSAL